MKIKMKKFTVGIQKKRLPNGMEAEMDVIEHPGAALIVPFLTKTKIILLRQYRAVLGKYLLELPAGTLDQKERPLACAKRELMEETNYSARRWKKLGRIYPVPGYATEIIHMYKAEGLTPVIVEGDPDEVIHPFICTRAEVKHLFKEGKIEDAKTVCALALCALL